MLVFLCVLGTVLVKAWLYRAPLAVLAGVLPRADFLDRQLAGPGTSFAEAESIAAEVRASLPAERTPRTTPCSSSATPSSSTCSGRPLPTAFYYLCVLTAMHTGGSAMADCWDARFAAELAATTPPVVYIGESVLNQARDADVPAAAVLEAWLAERMPPPAASAACCATSGTRVTSIPRPSSKARQTKHGPRIPLRRVRLDAP